MDQEEVLKILTEELEGKVDEGTLEYLSNMVAEEPADDADALWELIGEFLTDAGIDESEGPGLCATLFPKLRTEQEDSFDDKVLSAPMKMGEVLGVESQGFVDPFLGMKKAEANWNDTGKSLGESVKALKRKAAEREIAVRRMAEWEKQKKPPPPPKLSHQRNKPNDILVNRFSLSVAGKQLLNDASLKFIVGRKYGLVGRNGIGKSTLLHAFARLDINGMPKNLIIATVEQELTFHGDNKSALEHVLQVDVERADLMREEQRLQNMLNAGGDSVELTMQLDSVQSRLLEIDADQAPAKACQILYGLGFSEERAKAPVSSLSGGWRMRVALSRALFADPDVLLLDEPTNHLDLHAVAWLTTYLAQMDKTLIVVSHSRDFLNDICTDIILFKSQQLQYYKGDYDTYEKVRAAELKQREREIEAQERKVAHTQKFIDRFRFNAKRAAMVQSRIKMLNKLPMLEEIASDPTLSFHFEETETLPTPILKLDEVGFKYEEQRGADKGFHLRGVNMSVDLESRIAVCGANGCGKSTLLKLMLGELEAQKGFVQRHNRLRIGYFSQHHVETLDLTLTATQHLIAKFPERDLSEEGSRNWLGKFGITQELSMEPLYILSGGQKSRVAIAHVAFEKPHILVMDEPTNHLDLDAVQALSMAVNNFNGGVLIVSHDSHFLQCTCDEVWHVHEGVADKFAGDIMEFKKFLLKDTKRAFKEAQAQKK